MNANAEDVVFGGPGANLDSQSFSWGWSDGQYIVKFRGALENSANFGQGAPVELSISTVDLPIIDADTLSEVDVFVSSWWTDAQSAPYEMTIIEWFLGGGSLLLLQDDPNHDGIGDALGIPSSPGSGTPSTGNEPLFEGPFGSGDGATMNGLTGQFNIADIEATGGTIGGVNEQGQVTAAYWCEGDYAQGAGGMVILADVDLISTWDDPDRYNPLNANGRLALNTAAFLAERCVTTVDIDIKPGSDPNAVNLKSRGVIPVAVLGSDEFDATQIDPQTVVFGPDQAPPAHDGHIEDVNDDGFEDAVFHFNVQETGINCDDEDATLTGKTVEGNLIAGADAV